MYVPFGVCCFQVVSNVVKLIETFRGSKRTTLIRTTPLATRTLYKTPFFLLKMKGGESAKLKRIETFFFQNDNTNSNFVNYSASVIRHNEIFIAKFKTLINYYSGSNSKTPAANNRAQMDFV